MRILYRHSSFMMSFDDFLPSKTGWVSGDRLPYSSFENNRGGIYGPMDGRTRTLIEMRSRI